MTTRDAPTERARLRVAVIGTGYFSHFHYRAWQRMDDVSLVALHAVDKYVGGAFAADYNIPAVFDDVARLLDKIQPDLVDLITPPDSHEVLVGLCIERGIPVVCQKPFCANLETARRVVDRAEATDALVVVHENFRFQPWYRELRRLIDAGDIGELWNIRFDLRPGDGRGADAYLARQPYFRQQPRFLIRETGVHFVDVFRYLVGEVESVSAMLARRNPAIRGEDGGIVLFRFTNGATGVLDGNRLADHRAGNRRLTMGELTLEGSHSTVRLDGDGRLSIRPFDANASRDHDYAWQAVDFGGDCVFATCRHIADHLLSGTTIENQARDYLVNQRIESAIYRADETGERVAIEADPQDRLVPFAS